MPSPHVAEVAEKASHRLSISLNDEQYRQISDIARRNRVSIAWVMREAVERLLSDQQPLFHIRKPLS